jgi:lysophospholipase L1-like esterase
MQQISPDDSRIQYQGRIDRADKTAYPLVWPGTSIAIRFTGPAVELLMDSDADDFFQVILDGMQSTLRGNPDKKSYSIVPALPEGEHSFCLYKRTEMLGDVVFRGFQLGDGCVLLDPALAPSLRIEFYGDSITVGQSNEDGEEDQWPDHSTHNHYLSYDALTTRALYAELSCIAVSGIGLTQGFQPHAMRQIWDRYRPDPLSKIWDFTSWQADMVVINLGANDQSTGFCGNFADPYELFLLQLREMYPLAMLFAIIGPFSEETITGQIVSAVASRRQKGDANVHFHRLSQRTKNHPRVVVHRQMADELTDVIRKAGAGYKRASQPAS